MFWLEVSSRIRKIVFGSGIRVVYNPSGIAGVGGWRSRAEHQRKPWYIQHFINVRGRFRLTEEQAAIVSETLKRHTTGFATTCLALLRHGTFPRGTSRMGLYPLAAPGHNSTFRHSCSGGHTPVKRDAWRHIKPHRLL
jgi:hypothetical protein